MSVTMPGSLLAPRDQSFGFKPPALKIVGAGVLTAATASAVSLGACLALYRRRQRKALERVLSDPCDRDGLAFFRQHTANNNAAVAAEAPSQQNAAAVPDTTAAAATAAAEFLSTACLPIAIRPESVRPFTGPEQFYEMLLSSIRTASWDITLSSLYLGDGPLCRQLYAELSAAINRRLAAGLTSDRPLRITLLFDYNRMCTGTNRDALNDFLRQFHFDRAAFMAANANANASCPVEVQVGLLKLPSLLARPAKAAGRACEVLGVQHTKIFAFDDTRLILTGANLSDAYFTTCRDRYVAFENEPAAVAWYRGLAHALCDLAMPVTAAATGGATPAPATLPRWLDAHRHPMAFSRAARRRMDRFAADAAAALQQQQQPSTEASVAAVAIAATATPSTLLFPTLQFAKARVYHDAAVLDGLLARVLGAATPTAMDGSAPASRRLTIASPYLNCDRQLVQRLLAGGSTTTVCFVTAGLATNAWAGGGGLISTIPALYARMQGRLMDRFDKARRQQRCRSDRIAELFEYTAPGTTFHGKGLWISATAPGRVFLSAVGSANYGHRSTHLDVEAQGIVVTTDPTLQARLGAERDALFEHATRVDPERRRETQREAGRFLRAFAQLATPIVAPFL